MAVLPRLFIFVDIARSSSAGFGAARQLVCSRFRFGAPPVHKEKPFIFNVSGIKQLESDQVNVWPQRTERNMSLRRPTQDDLREVARANYLSLSEAEERAYATLFEEFLPRFDELDAMADPVDPRPQPIGERVEWLPTPLENPWNAIVRRCLVKGSSIGPLAGKRIGLKDNIGVAGVEMTLGSTVLRGFRPARDATVVSRLLTAGADIVAILNMDAFAYSGAGDTSLNGPTLNPHDKARLAGGSSGGSAAALYHDDIDITFGADQGGSIRIPASWCGVVGLKPTFGLVPYTGIAGIDHTYDHVGPLARRVADVALALDAVAGKDPFDPRQTDVIAKKYSNSLGKDLTGVRIGFLKEGLGGEGSEPDVEAAVSSALDRMARLGAEVSEVSVPMHKRVGPIAWGLFAEAVAAILQANGMGYHWRGVYDPEMAAAFGQGLQSRANELPPQGKIEAMLGTYLRTHYHGRFYAKAQNLRVHLREAYDTSLRKVDILAMPTTPMKAQPYLPQAGIVDRVLNGWSMLGNTAGFNMTGHPSLSMPCAISAGLPVGLMLTGRHFEDDLMLSAAHALEQHDAARAGAPSEPRPSR
jgi:amidase